MDPLNWCCVPAGCYNHWEEIKMYTSRVDFHPPELSSNLKVVTAQPHARTHALRKREAAGRKSCQYYTPISDRLAAANRLNGLSAVCALHTR